MKIWRKTLYFAIGMIGLVSCHTHSTVETLEIEMGDKIAIIGNNLCSRMMNFGHFETALHLRFPEQQLTIRNMCDGGNTPGFRPHPGRVSPWAFPGAENFYDNELANATNSQGTFASPDEWLTHIAPDIIFAFFGYNESFRGEDAVENYKSELSAFIEHTLSQKYSNEQEPELVLFSPFKFEDLSVQYDYPDGHEINDRLRIYTNAMAEVAHLKSVRFINLFEASEDWHQYTDDGFQLNDEGYKALSEYVRKTLFTPKRIKNEREQLVQEYVLEKNWFWHNDFKIPNGVHVYGRRYEPFGPDNYPAELEKIRQMTANRDSAIWNAAVSGKRTDLASMDQRTRSLPEVETNYNPENLEAQSYKYGEEYLNTFTMAPGYKLELFASEEDFPDLANPVQMSFDDKGRLWVSVMPSYPHYKPGDSRPDDKILILEDTDNDGKADKQTIFADSLHLPVGFEITRDGVYVSQGTNLKILIDEDGDDHADVEKIILSGFDDHDTHHNISAFCADPSGAIYMGEGVFLHTNVETAYGPERASNGGFFRYNPARNHLERTGNMPIPNPWGIAFDEWGQNFFLQTSGPNTHWMLPSTVKRRYGVAVPLTENLIEDKHRVRPTSGLEFISSRHFPDEVQGDMLLNNTIGFLGTKQHAVSDDSTGFSTKHRQDLLRSTDGNFRPVDLEFAPDGSLYIVDWHNILVGHMQHNARDPLRDHSHGRILRVTYPERPLVEPAKVHNASIEELFDNLKLPEYRSRYRSRRALRGKDPDAVFDALQEWKKDQTEDRHLLEGLWVSWGINKIDEALVNELMNSDNYKVRAAVVRAIRYNYDRIENAQVLLEKAAADPHGRVRLESIVTASWLSPLKGNHILDIAGAYDLDRWMENAFRYGRAHLNNKNVGEEEEEEIESHLTGDDLASFIRGKMIYEKDGSCVMCHQEDGTGLAESGFPPLQESEWVLENKEVLIKITLKGIYGPITVLGKEYPGQVPMPPYENMLNDQEIADVLTYVRNAFGNRSETVKANEVDFVRKATAEQKSYYSPEDLIRTHSIQ